MDVFICILLFEILRYSGSCSNLTAPVNLTIHSYHFVHLLTWEAGPGSPEETYFTVLFRSLSEDWRTVGGCVVVHFPLQCNLTDEFSDLRETYYTSVHAQLGEHTSASALYTPFQPFLNTVPEPPLLKVSQCNQSLCIQLRCPSPRLLEVYDGRSSPYVYKLRITVNGEREFLKTTTGLGDVVLEHLPPGQEYCVSVRVDNHSDERSAVCTHVPTALHNSEVTVYIVLTFIALLAGICLVLLWASHFPYLKSRLPSVLSSLQEPYEVFLLSWSSIGSLHSISMEPRAVEDTQCAAEEVEGLGGEDDARVKYESFWGQTLSGENSSKTQSSACPVWDRSRDPATETHTRPGHLSEVACSTVPSEGISPPPCRTAGQWRSKPPRAMRQALNTGLALPASAMEAPGQKHTSPVRYAPGPGWGIETEVKVEGVVNINLSSLTLGNHWGERTLGKMMTGDTGNNVPMELQALSSLHTMSDPTQNTQTMASLNSSSNTSGAEDEEEEEEYSDYLQHN